MVREWDRLEQSISNLSTVNVEQDVRWVIHKLTASKAKILPTTGDVGFEKEERSNVEWDAIQAKQLPDDWDVKDLDTIHDFTMLR